MSFECEQGTFDFDLWKHVAASPSRAQRLKLYGTEVLKPIDELEEELEPSFQAYGMAIAENVFLIRYYVELKKLVDEIVKQNAVGVLLGGENVSREGNVSWVLFSTETKIFQVDVHALAKQTHKLWDVLGTEIFSNRKLIKIFHDCRQASDYLMHTQNIMLCNVFDTQMADAIVFKNTTGNCIEERNDLSTCIEFYGIEMSKETLHYLRSFENQHLAQNSPWNRRPVPASNFMEFCVLQVKYLSALRNAQTLKMMEKFNKCVEECLDVANENYSRYWFIHPKLVSQGVKLIIDGPRQNKSSSTC